MPTQIVRIGHLLAAGCAVRLRGAIEQRQVHDYASEQLPWTVMRHFLAVSALPIGVTEAPFTALLVAAPGRPQRSAASRSTAPT